METTYTIEVLQEDIDNAVKQYDDMLICTCCIINKALNRTFKHETFKTSFAYADSNKRKLILSEQPKHSFLPGREWKNMEPFTFTATEY